MRITLNNINDVFRVKQCSIDTMELKGYTLIKELFCDSSGLGASDELALTQDQFLKELTELLEEHEQLTAKITNVGQFQCYVGLFTKTGKNQMKKIDNNTYKIDTDNGYKIRLHDTNILEYKGSKIILDSGGFQTRTTKDRLNKYLPNDVYIYQKDFDWYLKRDNKIIPFKDEMIIKQ